MKEIDPDLLDGMHVFITLLQKGQSSTIIEFYSSRCLADGHPEEVTRVRSNDIQIKPSSLSKSLLGVADHSLPCRTAILKIR